MTTPLLTTKRLGITRAGKCLIKALDLSFSAGERWALLGLNGAGKSSLLDALSGLLPLSEGQAHYRSTLELRALSAEALSQLRTHVSQRYSPRFAMRAASFVAQGAANEQAAARWMQRLDVSALAERDITALSGGELQRVVLARHLARERALCLLDEPLTHLDPAHQQQLMQRLMSEDFSTRCVIAAVHDIKWAQGFATHVLLLARDADGAPVHIAGAANAVLNAENLRRVYGVRFEAVNTSTGSHWLY